MLCAVISWSFILTVEQVNLSFPCQRAYFMKVSPTFTCFVHSVSYFLFFYFYFVTVQPVASRYTD